MAAQNHITLSHAPGAATPRQGVFICVFSPPGSVGTVPMRPPGTGSCTGSPLNSIVTYAL